MGSYKEIRTDLSKLIRCFCCHEQKDIRLEGRNWKHNLHAIINLDNYDYQ